MWGQTTFQWSLVKGGNLGLVSHDLSFENRVECVLFANFCDVIGCGFRCLCLARPNEPRRPSIFCHDHLLHSVEKFLLALLDVLNDFWLLQVARLPLQVLLGQVVTQGRVKCRV